MILKANNYSCMRRCELPKLQFLNFEAVPLLDLRVTSTDEDCLVEMLSCKVFPSPQPKKNKNVHDVTPLFFVRVIETLKTHSLYTQVRIL